MTSLSKGYKAHAQPVGGCRRHDTEGNANKQQRHFPDTNNRGRRGKEQEQGHRHQHNATATQARNSERRGEGGGRRRFTPLLRLPPAAPPAVCGPQTADPRSYRCTASAAWMAGVPAQTGTAESGDSSCGGRDASETQVEKCPCQGFTPAVRQAPARGLASPQTNRNNNEKRGIGATRARYLLVK